MAHLGNVAVSLVGPGDDEPSRRRQQLPEGLAIVGFLAVLLVGMLFMLPLTERAADKPEAEADALLANTEVRASDLPAMPFVQQEDGSFATRIGSGENAAYEYVAVRGGQEQSFSTADMADPEVVVETAASDQGAQVRVQVCASSPGDPSKPYVDRPVEHWGPEGSREPLCHDRIVLVVPQNGIVQSEGNRR